MTSRRVAVVVSGVPAAGKTTFAHALAEELGVAVVVDKDDVAGPLVSAAFAAAGRAEDLDGPWYKRHLSPAAYEATILTAIAVLDGGAVPVLVAPWQSAVDDPGWHGRLRARLRADRLEVVWCKADAATLRHRMQLRAAARDAAKLAAWDTWVADLDLGREPPWPHILLDTTDGNLPDLRARARALAASITAAP